MNKKSASAVLDRLQQALGTDSDSELCRVIGVNRATLGNWRNRDSVPYSLCVNLSERNNLSLDWLIIGEGEMLKGKPITSAMDMKAAKMAELLDGLSEDQQREILTIIEKNKRLNELEEIVFQLQKKVG